MMAHIHGYRFTTYKHFFSNPQIYDIQIESAKKLLGRSPTLLPKVCIKVDREIEDPWEFRVDDFVLEDYHPHKWLTIPTPI